MDSLTEQEKDPHILIVDDEARIRLTFEIFLAREEYGPITTASTMEEALIVFQNNTLYLLISDIVLEGEKGTDLLCIIQEAATKYPVVLVAGSPSLDDAASEAVRRGAFDDISKPEKKETLSKFVRLALKHWNLEKEKKKLLQENEKFKRYLETIFSSVRDAIITIDNNMNIVQLNATAKRWLLCKYTDNAERIKLESLQSEMAKACLQDATQVLKNRKDVFEHQVECKKYDGNIRIISLNATLLEDGQDDFKRVVIVARDITIPEPGTAPNSRNQFHGYVGSSQVMQNVYNLIENVGKVDTAVLITGESGTGKALAAEALHAESCRRNIPLVKVDCTALPEELLERELFGHVKGAFTGADKNREGLLLQAHNGTLFLDEIGDITPHMQVQLHRLLQEKIFTPVGQDTPVKVDVRIIAATNVNCTGKVKNGSFKEDLYSRLKVVDVKLPPLRDRKGDISILVHHFLSLFRERLKRNIHRISDQAMDSLSRYSWPGNVRELRHVMERACVLCEGSTIFPEHFPGEIQNPTHPASPSPMEMSWINATAPLPPYISERDEIIDILKRARGNKTKAARMLNIDRSTLYRKMQRIGIAPNIAKPITTNKNKL